VLDVLLFRAGVFLEPGFDRSWLQKKASVSARPSGVPIS
jgi:hypothetical protein